MHDVSGDARYRTIAEQRIVDMLLLNGWRFDVADGRRDEAAKAAHAALEACVTAGLPFFRDDMGARRFDPVETWNFLKWAAEHGRDRLWEGHCVAAARRQIRETPGPSRFSVSLTRTFNLAGRRQGEKLRLRLPAALDEPTLTQLSVEFLTLPPDVVETSRGPGRLDALVLVGEREEIGVGCRATFVTNPDRCAQTSPLTIDEAALYTRPTEGLIRVNARIRALAADLAAGETNDLGIARRCWDFILDTFACGSIHYDVLDPERPLDWVLDHGWYDCVLGSALMAGMLRARGVPARLVTGYMLHVTAPAFHTWLEAWIEGTGWMPLDLWAWELSAGGRDPPWRDHYFGKIEPRMVVERPPRLFGGTGAVRLPRRFLLLPSLTERGARTTFEDAETGAWTYHEDVEVRQAPLDDPRPNLEGETAFD
jgi:hypothetical protein